MRINGSWRFWLASLAAAWALAALVQAAGGAQASSRVLPASATSGQAEQSLGSSVVREIDDPHNGDHWLLVRDSDHPGGPGRMILGGKNVVQPVSDVSTPSRQARLIPALPMPVIHGGDRVIVEEHSARVDVRLEAVALGPAVSGSPLNVRLTIGGDVVRGVALGPGRVAFAKETAVRP